jgi:hypothetical protein
MFKKIFPCTLLGLALFTACNANPSQKTVKVEFSVCNTADQPLAEVYLNGNFAGGGNREYGRSGMVCCSRIPVDQPVTVEWEMDMYYRDPKPMPSYKVSVPIKGTLQPDKTNYLGIYVNEKGQARVEVKTSDEYLGPTGMCQAKDMEIGDD